MKNITNYNEVEDILKKDFVMVIAKSHTCSACQTIESALEKNVPSLSKIDTYSLYIDDFDKFRGDYLIFSVPTILIFNNEKELLRESRYINYDKINRLIQLYTD